MRTRNRSAKSTTEKPAPRKRSRAVADTSKELPDNVVYDKPVPDKPSKAFGTMWVAMIVLNKLDGDLTPFNDVVTTKATNQWDAIRNIGAYYNHARRVPATQLSVIMIMPFSDFVTKRMCIDYESMPMLDDTDTEGLPDDVVELIQHIEKMPREQIDAEIKALYAAERTISEARPLAKERKAYSIGDRTAEEAPESTRERPKRARTRTKTEEAPKTRRRRR